MNITTDIIIIGAGIIGTATAFELGKKRYKTINIDKLPAAGPLRIVARVSGSP